MPVVTKIAPMSRDLQILVDETLSPAAQSRAFADFARGELRDAETINARVLGRIPPHKTFVDGREGAALETVRPDGGVIVFNFAIITDVLLFIGETLKRFSPVASGAYRDAHSLFADGVEVLINATIPQAAEYVFTNPLPYSRKIEIGRTKSGRSFTIHVPGHVYERAAQVAKARFGNVAKIRFSFISASGAVGAGGAKSIRRYGGPASRRGGIERATRLPAITVTPN